MIDGAIETGFPLRPSRLRLARTLGVIVLLVALLPLTGVLSAPSRAFAAEKKVDLGTADSYAVLAGSTMTNTGPSVLNADLGLSQGSAVTGFPPGQVRGTKHVTDAAASKAKSDLTIAYNDAASRATTASKNGDLVGQTLVAGVYTSAKALGLNGTVTLNGQNDPNSVFIFQVGSTLITGSRSRVAFINGAQSCNVFWQIGSSATLGTNSDFAGTIMARTSVTLNTGTTLNGRALARNGAVTLNNNVVTSSACRTAAVVQSESARESTSASQSATVSHETTNSGTGGSLASTGSGRLTPVIGIGGALLLLLGGTLLAVAYIRSRPKRRH
jgi:hypothetical protein